MTNVSPEAEAGGHPSLPPVFSTVMVGRDQSLEDRTFDTIKTAYDIGDDPTGTVVVADRPDMADCAFILGPDRPLKDALNVVHVMMLALNDAVGAIIPPQIAVTFGWPDRIMINGALAGGLRLTLPQDTSDELDETPDWMVLRLTLDVLGEPIEEIPGHPVERTSLLHEGCVDIAPTVIIESVARHFLNWISRWERDGINRIREAWDGRAHGYQEQISFRMPGGGIKGRLLGLDEEGGLMVSRNGKKKTAPLRWILAGHSWAPGTELGSADP